MSLEIIKFFFEFQINLKLYHWTTNSYPRHKASDQLQESLNQKIDRFVEVYMGRLGKPSLKKQQNISYTAISDQNITGYLRSQLKKLENFDLNSYAELKNIRDEMIESINQALYLFALE